jgi:hypothetical protein
MNIEIFRIARPSLSVITLIAFAACAGTGSGRPAAGPDTTYKVGGTVSGLNGQGLTIELLNPATPAHHTTILEQIDVVANGAFVFRMPASQGYGVAIVHQPHAPMQRCVVRSGRGVIGTTDFSNVDIVCSDLV